MIGACAYVCNALAIIYVACAYWIRNSTSGLHIAQCTRTEIKIISFDVRSYVLCVCLCPYVPNTFHSCGFNKPSSHRKHTFLLCFFFFCVSFVELCIGDCTCMVRQQTWRIDGYELCAREPHARERSTPDWWRHRIIHTGAWCMLFIYAMYVNGCHWRIARELMKCAWCVWPHGVDGAIGRSTFWICGDWFWLTGLRWPSPGNWQPLNVHTTQM